MAKATKTDIIPPTPPKQVDIFEKLEGLTSKREKMYKDLELDIMRIRAEREAEILKLEEQLEGDIATIGVEMSKLLAKVATLLKQLKQIKPTLNPWTDPQFEGVLKDLGLRDATSIPVQTAKALPSLKDGPFHKAVVKVLENDEDLHPNSWFVERVKDNKGEPYNKITVSSYMKRLADEGLLSKSKTGREVLYGNPKPVS